MSRVKIPRPRDWASSSLQSAWKLSSFVDFTSLKDFEWMQWWTWGQIHWDDVTKMEKVVPRGHFTLFCIYTKTFFEWTFDLPLLKEKLLENKHSSIIFIISQTESLFCYLVDSIKNFKLGGEDEGICHAKWHVKCKISPFSSSQVVFASVQTIIQRKVSPWWHWTLRGNWLQ